MLERKHEIHDDLLLVGFGMHHLLFQVELDAMHDVLLRIPIHPVRKTFRCHELRGWNPRRNEMHRFGFA